MSRIVALTLTLAALVITAACGDDQAAPSSHQTPVASPSFDPDMGSASQPTEVASPSVDPDTAWRQAVEAVYGHSLPRWSQYRALYLDPGGHCWKSQRDMETFLAVGQDSDGKWGSDYATDLQAMRVSLHAACPEQEAVLDKALAAVASALETAPTTDCGPLPKKKPAQFALVCMRLQSGDF